MIRLPHTKQAHGFALLVVLILLTLCTVLVTGILLSVTNELKNAKTASNGEGAHQLADAAVQVVIGQLAQATTTGGGTTTWASQPGMIRTYDNTGTEQSNYKLYSSSIMTTNGQLTLAGTAAAGANNVNDYDPNWSSNTALWTDLNAPVVVNESGVTTDYYPIVSGNNLTTINGNLAYPPPPGAPASITVGVQGFDVDSAKTPVAPTGNVINPVPMPVQWLYQLQDGTLVAPGTASGANTVSVAGATAANPIIGRIAFWTDDETSKININTACGDEWAPTAISVSAPGSPPAGNPSLTPPGAFWDDPRVYTAYDFNNLAYLQPAQNEFQRYPGHPATVYVSAVFPSFTRDQLFSLIPRISGGGSEGGTQMPSGLVTPNTNRLYASVDELLFKPTDATHPPQRDLNDTSATILDKATMQQSKFFLTANSRAPEVNLFGKPRIAIWPIDKDVVVQAASGSQSPRGTAFDNLIAFCSHLGTPGSGHDYFFQRTQNGYMSPTADYNIIGVDGSPRNQILYSYLQTMMNQNIPGFGGNLAQKFNSGGNGKPDSDQILTEIFDYIRCVNPSDDNLGYDVSGSPNGGGRCYTPSDQYVNGQGGFLTGGYGNLNDVLSPLPYHAFIVPAQITTNGNLTQGFGRTVTISEMGLAFICTADGGVSGTAAKAGDGGLNVTVGANTYYSNFPPLALDPTKPLVPAPTAALIAANPFLAGSFGYKTPTSPGFIPSNWNRTLPVDTNWATDPMGNQWTGLQPGQRRIEAIFLVNPYTVSPGYSTMHMDLGVQITGLNTFAVVEPNRPMAVPATIPVTLFPSTGTIVMASPTYRTPTFGVNYTFFNGLFYEPPQQMPDGIAGQVIGDVTPAPVTQGNPPLTHSPLAYPFVSVPFTVTVPPTGSPTMALTSGGTIQVKIWHLSAGDETIENNVSLNLPSGQLIQTINVDSSQLTGKSIAIPPLVRTIDTGQNRENNDSSTPNTNPNPAVDNPACEWDFSRQGVFSIQPAGLVGGRFYTTFGQGGHLCDPIFTLEDSVRTLVPGYPTDTNSTAGDYRLLAATTTVPSSVFVPHRLVNDNGPYPMQHSFINIGENAWHFADQDTDKQILPTGIVSPLGGLLTSTPKNQALAGGLSNYVPALTGDFDNGYGSDMDGPYINKPDTGCSFNLGAYNSASGYNYPFFQHFAEESSPTFFSPNRQISSPGMFGSLPVGVKRGLPWQTLLFRPQPGHPNGVPVPDTTTANGGSAPYPNKVADHLLMDLFWMPVVEPYAISEPFSTAGKINLNYQIAPFTYITRATALDGLLKSQRMLAIPNYSNATANYKSPIGYSSNGAPPANDFRYDLNLSPVNGTLRQFEEKFAAGDIFRSPTQICDIYLTPSTQSWTSNAQATNFWAANQPTGDNSREKPYANLYGCLTTKSNTYTVHFRVQTLKKTLNTPVGQWVDNKDVVASDYRGSSLIERYVDTSDTTLPDFATTPGANLDTYYKFRVLSTRKFSP